MTDPVNAEDDLVTVAEALTHAENTFFRYAKLHRDKGTDDGDRKACANASMGEEMGRAIAALEAVRSTRDGEIERLRNEVLSLAEFIEDLAAPNTMVMADTLEAEAKRARQALNQGTDEGDGR